MLTLSPSIPPLGSLPGLLAEKHRRRPGTGCRWSSGPAKGSALAPTRSGAANARRLQSRHPKAHSQLTRAVHPMLAIHRSRPHRPHQEGGHV